MKIKVTKGDIIISNQVEMADQYLGGGAKPTHGLAHRSAWGSAWRSAQDLAQGLVWGSARGVGPGVGLVVSLGPGPGIGLELALGGQVDGSQTGSGGQLWRPAQGLAQRVAQG